MKVEIWSDIICPFCYIGKRRFEHALAQFEGHKEIEIIWRSFQLDPTLKYVEGKDIHDLLSEKKGMSREEAKEMNNHVSNMAEQAGIKFNFDTAAPANTFDAHRLSHLAAKFGLQDKAEEKLFSAYFTDGKNIEDKNTLRLLGEEIGLAPSEVSSMLNSDTYSKEVTDDINLARAYGIRGVPFFLLDGKVSISGAQHTQTFLSALNDTYTNWQKENKNSDDGNICNEEEGCALND